jgi:hypothetical protein
MCFICLVKFPLHLIVIIVEYVHHHKNRKDVEFQLEAQDVNERVSHAVRPVPFKTNEISMEDSAYFLYIIITNNFMQKDVQTVNP